MKLNVTITGQDTSRLAERFEQLARSRAASATPPTEDDPVPTAPLSPSARRPQRDRRS